MLPPLPGKCASMSRYCTITLVSARIIFTHEWHLNGRTGPARCTRCGCLSSSSPMKAQEDEPWLEEASIIPYLVISHQLGHSERRMSIDTGVTGVYMSCQDELASMVRNDNANFCEVERMDCNQVAELLFAFAALPSKPVKLWFTRLLTFVREPTVHSMHAFMLIHITYVMGPVVVDLQCRTPKIRVLSKRYRSHNSDHKNGALQHAWSTCCRRCPVRWSFWWSGALGGVLRPLKAIISLPVKTCLAPSSNIIYHTVAMRNHFVGWWLVLAGDGEEYRLDLTWASRQLGVYPCTIALLFHTGTLE